MMRLTCWAGPQAKAGAARESLPGCQNCISSLTRHILTECPLSVGWWEAAGGGSYWWSF